MEGTLMGEYFLTRAVGLDDNFHERHCLPFTFSIHNLYKTQGIEPVKIEEAHASSNPYRYPPPPPNGFRTGCCCDECVVMSCKLGVSGDIYTSLLWKMPPLSLAPVLVQLLTLLLGEWSRDDSACQFTAMNHVLCKTRLERKIYPLHTTSPPSVYKFWFLLVILSVSMLLAGVVIWNSAEKGSTRSN